MIQIEIITPEGRRQIEIDADYDVQGVVEIRFCRYCDKPLFVVLPESGTRKLSCCDTHRKMWYQKNRE